MKSPCYNSSTAKALEDAGKELLCSILLELYQIKKEDHNKDRKEGVEYSMNVVKRIIEEALEGYSK